MILLLFLLWMGALGLALLALPLFVVVPLLFLWWLFGAVR